MVAETKDQSSGKRPRFDHVSTAIVCSLIHGFNTDSSHNSTNLEGKKEVAVRSAGSNVEVPKPSRRIGDSACHGRDGRRQPSGTREA